jgi:protein SCO1/2
MTKQMKRLYNEFKDEPNVFFLSHTIDPQHDSVRQLKQHALLLGVESTKWHFVTGNEDSIYNIAEHSYYSSAHADSTADGGLIHSGGFILIDKNKNIRGIYDGTDATATAKLIITIKTLLKEQFEK